MSEKYNIQCLMSNEEKMSVVEIWENDDNVKICCKINNVVVEKSCDNFFETLIEVRKELEHKEIQLLCKGCSKNVYPSGMLLNMGAGRKAYTLVIGEQAKRDSLVDIFEDCNLNEYASVEEQYKFFQEWTKSLRR